MNALKLQSIFAKPENVSFELVPQRMSALLGLAVAGLATLPTAPIPADSCRLVFNNDQASVRGVLFQINEVIPFDVDKAMEIAFRIWERRYALVYSCFVTELTGDSVFVGTVDKLIPNYSELGIGYIPIKEAMDFLRSEISG